MKKNKKFLLSFDLDFTLIDNSEGIVNSFNYALKKYNLPEIDELRIKKMIGTPLDTMFARATNFETSLLSSAFREYYVSKGIFQVKLIPRVKNKLEELKNSFVLGVITSKKQEMAVKLLKYLDLDKYFNYILGETEDRKSKTDSKLKDYLLDRYPDYKFIVIGDHPNDGMLAEMLKCPFIAVLTGNHTAKQLKKGLDIKMLILNSINEITKDIINSLY